MKKIYSLLLPIMIIVVFGSCKKDKVEDMGRDQVRMALLSIESEEYTSAKVTGGYKNTIKASIISPGAIDLTDHGFIITINPGLYNYIKLGSTKKIGYVEFICDTSINLAQGYEIVFYGITQAGDTLKSDDAVSSKSFDIFYQTSQAPMVVPLATEVYFVSPIINNNTSSLTIISQGVNFDTQLNYTNTKNFGFGQKADVNVAQKTYDGYTGATTPLTVNSADLTLNEYYTFEVFYVVKNSISGETRTYTSKKGTFQYQGK